MPIPTPIEYLKQQIDGLIFDRKHYPWVDDKLTLQQLEIIIKECKQIEKGTLIIAFEEGQKMEGKSGEEYFNEKFS